MENSSPWKCKSISYKQISYFWRIWKLPCFLDVKNSRVHIMHPDEVDKKICSIWTWDEGENEWSKMQIQWTSTDK